MTPAAAGETWGVSVDAQDARERELADALAGLNPVLLPQLDERASLLRRVDNKYAVEWSRFLELIDRLRSDHDVLEIDGRREFGYRSVYFDTPDLRCFADHAQGRSPRFKARTRLYEDTGSCVFEVKLKPADGETDKRQTNHPPDQCEVLTPAASECLAAALHDAGLEVPDRMEAALSTSFRRVTLASRGAPQRLTCDIGVRLSSPRGGTAMLSGDVVLVETKTETGEGAAYDALAGMRLEPISLSKYRVGIGLVAVDEPQPGSELFD